MTDIKTHIKKYIVLCIWFWISILYIRIIEIICSTFYAGNLQIHIINNALGFCFDSIYFFLSAVAIAPIYLIACHYVEKITTRIFRSIASIAIFIGLLLVFFYAQAQFPLDRVLFLYSPAEIKETIINSNAAPWWMYLLLFIYPILFFFVSNSNIQIHKSSSFCICFLLLFCLTVHITKYNKSIENQGYLEQCNKIGYFLNSIIDGFLIERIDINTIYKEATIFHNYFPQKEFISPKCPFLHKKDTTNVLGPFFNLDSIEKPHIIIIFVEGLGSENSGKYSKYASATPFLDSLAEHSLIWNNCFSISQRTYGVMPGVFGALPFGSKGFMAYKQNAPEFYSIPKFLTSNGYQFSFYYGGWYAFDDMNHFIDLQKGKQYFANNNDTIAPRNSWGLLDKFLFQEAIKNTNFTSNQPRLDVYMTLTSHDPWKYPNEQNYIQQYEQLAEKQKKSVNPNKKAAASYLYVDEALKQFFYEYNKQKGSENTIFLITGDHNFNTSTFILERYHVPLIIWSSKLQKTQEFPAIVTHRDIPNSIISLLEKQYKLESPKEIAWINNSLDTVSHFRSQTFCPQSDQSRTIVSMIYNENFFYNNDCYNINYQNNVLQLTKQNNKHIADSISKLFSIYKNLDLFVCSFNALLDSNKVYTNRKELFHKETTRQFTDLFANSEQKDTAVLHDKYIPLLTFPLQTKLNKLALYFSCKIHSRTNKDPNLNLVITIQNSQNEVIHYDSYLIQLNNSTDWNSYLFNDAIFSSKDFLKDGNILFIYIWNPNKHTIELTNIQSSLFDLK